jgi:uncharacterized damage-inducible protein DinB
MSEEYPPLAITGYWSRLNDSIIDLVDYIPDDKLGWSPKDGLWNFRGLVLHISLARHNWMERDVQDGLALRAGPAAPPGDETLEERTRAFLQHGRTKEELKDHLRWSWDRLQGLLADPARLAGQYSGTDADGIENTRDGHWIAFHGLEHDVHHRADMFHYLALLGIEHPEVGTP